MKEFKSSNIRKFNSVVKVITCKKLDNNKKVIKCFIRIFDCRDGSWRYDFTLNEAKKIAKKIYNFINSKESNICFLDEAIKINSIKNNNFELFVAETNNNESKCHYDYYVVSKEILEYIVHIITTAALKSEYSKILSL